MLSKSLLAASGGGGEIGADWRWINGISQAKTVFGYNTPVRAITVGTKIVYLGDKSKIAISEDDGVTWTVNVGLFNAGKNKFTPRDIFYDGTQYIVTGGLTDAQILTSPDAINWTDRSSGLNAVWSGVTSNSGAYSAAYNGSVYVVVGRDGKVATSSDLVTWTYQAQLSSTTFGTDTITQVAWNGSVFLACNYTGHAATSTDGVTWTYQSGLKAVTGVVCSRIFWDSSQSQWIFTGYGTTNAPGVIITGTADAVTWTVRSNPGTNSAMYDIAYNGAGRYVVGSYYGHYVSTNGGVSWSFVSLTSATSLGTGNTKIPVWTGTQFITLSNLSAWYSINGNTIGTTYNGLNQYSTIFNQFNINDVRYVNNTWVVVGA